MNELNEDNPLWLVNEQIKGLFEGDGASEDHDDVRAFLLKTGLPESTVAKIHKAIVGIDAPLRSNGFIRIANKRMELPAFDESLPDEQAQQLVLMDQGEFVALIQWDGAGESQHWVLVPKDGAKLFIDTFRKVASE